MSCLEYHEQEIEQVIIGAHSYELGLIEGVQNAYTDAFSRIGGLTPTEENRTETVQLLLAARSFNFIRSGGLLLRKGYYSEAIILARATEENALVARYCEIAPDVVSALMPWGNTNEYPIPSFKDMAKQLENRGKVEAGFVERWERNYGPESTIAHPRQRALRMIVNPHESRLSLGPEYDKEYFIGACEALLRAAMVMPLFNLLDRFLQDADKHDWDSRHGRVAKEVVGWRERIQR